MFFRRAFIIPATLLVWFSLAAGASGATISMYWSDVVLDDVRQTHAGPPSVAQMIAIVRAAMHDAWTAYDPIAVPTQPNGILKRPPEEMTESNKLDTVSFAEHKVIVYLFPSMASSADAALRALGYDMEDVGSTDTTTPAGIGNVAANVVIALRAAMTAPTNSYNNYDTSTYTQFVPVYTQPGSTDDSNSW